jgi:hypothetical protein
LDRLHVQAVGSEQCQLLEAAPAIIVQRVDMQVLQDKAPARNALLVQLHLQKEPKAVLIAHQDHLHQVLVILCVHLVLLESFLRQEHPHVAIVLQVLFHQQPDPVVALPVRKVPIARRVLQAV